MSVEINVCDHALGYMHELVRQSEIQEKLKSEAFGWNNHNTTMNSLARGNEKILKEDYKPSDFLDGRKRGCMTMFNYCPYCGEKIDWKEIKKAI